MFGIIILILVLVCSGEVRAGGWEWKLGAEGGYFNAQGDYDARRIRYATALSASAKSDWTKGPHFLNFNGRVRPEWYGPQSDNYIINASAGIQYRRTFRRLVLDAGLQLRNKDYHLHSGRLSVNTTQIFGLATWSATARTSAELEGRYAQANASGEPDYKIFTRSLLPGVKFSFSRYGNLSCAGLLESFETRTDNSFITSRSARGWRWGSQWSFEYTRYGLINLQYLAADRTYEHSDKHRIEQEAHVIAGKNLSPHWSLFVLADYYYIAGTDSTSGDPLHAQASYENRVHAKLAYLADSGYEYYFKAAYSRNELLQQNITLSGFQISVGIEIRK